MSDSDVPRWGWVHAGDGGPQRFELDPSDVSLTFDAGRREVTRHADGRAEVIGDDVFAALARELADGRVEDRWYGYFGYAARTDLPGRRDASLPDAVWMRPSRVESVAAPATGTGAVSPVGGDAGAAPDDYRAAFATVQEHLHAGNSYEVNLTYRADARSGLAPADVFARLWALNPAPYAAYLHHDVPGARAFVASSSPERFARIDRSHSGRTLEAKPIKGTTPRSADPAEDAAAADRLRTDQRFRSENLMIVDLLRHDLSQVCEIGSVEVPALMAVESYATVHQLVSTVQGALRDDVASIEALRQLFPAGSMTGAPKLRTMQIIDEVESSPRGVYAGAHGWIAADGRADLGVVIRTLVTDGSDTYTLGTGGGITVQSDADEEYAETRWKADRLLRALEE